MSLTKSVSRDQTQRNGKENQAPRRALEVSRIAVLFHHNCLLVLFWSHSSRVVSWQHKGYGCRVTRAFRGCEFLVKSAGICGKLSRDTWLRMCKGSCAGRP